MIVISHPLVLDPVETATPSDHPLIGANNVVTISNIAADPLSTLAGYPASNLANPATHREWRSNAVADRRLTVTTDGITPVDYLAIAKHNFGSAQIAVSVEGLIDGVNTTIAGPVMLTDDSPVLFRFPLAAMPTVKLLMLAGIEAPRAAVMYLGKLLVMEKRIYVGHTPLPHARRSTFSNGMSESGNFLGRIQLGSWRETVASFHLISPAWYRSTFDPFLAQQKQLPFFFAWRPLTYPLEVGYGWLIDDPMPTPQDSGEGNLIAVDLHIGGVA